MRKVPDTKVNPCRECVKTYDETPCTKLGHCIFEGTNQKPSDDMPNEPEVIVQLAK